MKQAKHLRYLYRVVIVLAVLALGAGPATPVMIASGASSLQAEVEVLPVAAYGARVVRSSNTWSAELALGEPDESSAVITYSGWIQVQMENTVFGAMKVGFRGSNNGWTPSLVSVYTSKDGVGWIKRGQLTVTGYGLQDYVLEGEFGEVRYLMLKRGGLYSYFLLDAVFAKGGGPSKEE